MIMATKIFQGPCLVLACSALSACLGGSTSGTGGGGGGGGGGAGGPKPISPAAFAAAHDRVSGMGPTIDMPISGMARFAGEGHATLNRGASQLGELMGDIEMSVDFAAANSPGSHTRAMSGRISNIRGTIGKEQVSFDGALTTADAKSKSLDSTVVTTTSTFNAPIIGTTTTRTGSIMGHFTGDVALGGDSGPVIVQLGGAFTGPGAQGATGTVGGTMWDPGNPEAYTIAGRFYLDRK